MFTMEFEKNMDAKMAGYLEKKAKLSFINRWRKRWCILDGQLLMYYKSRVQYLRLSPCCGCLNMALVLSIQSNTRRQIHLQTHSQFITLRTKTRAKQEEWYNALMNAMPQKWFCDVSALQKHYALTSSDVQFEYQDENSPIRDGISPCAVKCKVGESIIDKWGHVLLEVAEEYPNSDSSRNYADSFEGVADPQGTVDEGIEENAEEWLFGRRSDLESSFWDSNLIPDLEGKGLQLSDGCTVDDVVCNMLQLKEKVQDYHESLTYEINEELRLISDNRRMISPATGSRAPSDTKSSAGGSSSESNVEKYKLSRELEVSKSRCADHRSRVCRSRSYERVKEKALMRSYSFRVVQTEGAAIPALTSSNVGGCKGNYSPVQIPEDRTSQRKTKKSRTPYCTMVRYRLRTSGNLRKRSFSFLKKLLPKRKEKLNPDIPFEQNEEFKCENLDGHFLPSKSEIKNELLEEHTRPSNVLACNKEVNQTGKICVETEHSIVECSYIDGNEHISYPIFNESLENVTNSNTPCPNPIDEDDKSDTNSTATNSKADATKINLENGGENCSLIQENEKDFEIDEVFSTMKKDSNIKERTENMDTECSEYYFNDTVLKNQDVEIVYEENCTTTDQDGNDFDNVEDYLVNGMEQELEQDRNTKIEGASEVKDQNIHGNSFYLTDSHTDKMFANQLDQNESVKHDNRKNNSVKLMESSSFNMLYCPECQHNIDTNPIIPIKRKSRSTENWLNVDNDKQILARNDSNFNLDLLLLELLVINRNGVKDDCSPKEEAAQQECDYDIPRPHSSLIEIINKRKELEVISEYDLEMESLSSNYDEDIRIKDERSLEITPDSLEQPWTLYQKSNVIREHWSTAGINGKWQNELNSDEDIQYPDSLNAVI